MKAMAKMFLTIYFAFAPSHIDPWRLEMRPPARVLPVGDPVQFLY